MEPESDARDRLARTWTCLLRANGNEATDIWGELFEYYGPSLAIGIRNRMRSWPRLRNVVMVEDVLQEVALVAFKRHKQLVDPSGTGPLRWLTRIADYVLKDMVDRESRRLVIGLIETPGDSDVSGDGQCVSPAGSAKTASVRLQRDEAIQRAERILSALEDGDRDILVWARFEGLSHQEIAERLAVSVEASRTRLKRARERMEQIRDALDREEGLVELPPDVGYHD